MPLGNESDTHSPHPSRKLKERAVCRQEFWAHWRRAHTSRSARYVSLNDGCVGERVDNRGRRSGVKQFHALQSALSRALTKA